MIKYPILSLLLLLPSCVSVSTTSLPTLDVQAIIGSNDLALYNSVDFKKKITKLYPDLSEGTIEQAIEELYEEGKGVCLVININKIVNDQPITKPYQHVQNLNEGQQMASIPAIIKDEEFRSSTGFLISENKVLTARHVVERANFDELRFIFDYNLSSDEASLVYNGFTGVMEEVSPEQVYKASSIVALGKGSVETKLSTDWCVIELDRPVSNAKILEISRKSVQKNMRLSMIGHPDGMPMTIAMKGKVLKELRDREGGIEGGKSYRCSLDSFHGNSGSPVFSFPEIELIGLYVAGKKKDFKNGNLYKYPEESENILQSFIPIHHLKDMINNL